MFVRSSANKTHASGSLRPWLPMGRLGTWRADMCMAAG
jgi:hypothetical protein